MPFILAAALIAFLVYLVVPPAFPFLQTDSGSYIHFEAMRTPGYPMFLMAVEKIFGELRSAVPLQLAAMVASAAYLACEIRRLTQSTLLGLVALALIVANVFIYRYAFTIMSEALFLSALALLVGLICRFAAAPSTAIVAALSFTIAISILIRPVAYIFVPILLLCAVIRYRAEGNRLRLVSYSALPMALVLTSGALAYYSHHGSFRTQSFLGHNLIGKTAYLPGSQVASRFPEIVALIDAHMQPLRDVRIASLSDRFLFRERHYDFVRYGLTTPLVERLSAAGAGEPDDIRKEVALAYIKAHPVDFAGEVWLQLYSLWTVAELRTATDNQRFNALIASLPFKGTSTPSRASMPWPAVYGIRAFVLGILVLTLFSIGYGAVALVRKRAISLPWMALIMISFLLHGYMALVAALQAGHFRYLIVMWPAIVAIAVLSGHIVLARLFPGWDKWQQHGFSPT